MNENIDQFGRSNKSRGDDKIIDNTNLDQSKKIKQSLAEIKEQLIQENFKIQSSEKIQSNKPENIEINSSSFKTIKELENKIKSLEFDFQSKIDEKINTTTIFSFMCLFFFFVILLIFKYLTMCLLSYRYKIPCPFMGLGIFSIFNK